jgi:hypothetical protein
MMLIQFIGTCEMTPGEKWCQPPNLVKLGNLPAHLTHIWWLAPFSPRTSRHKFAVCCSGEAVEGVRRELAARHEVGELLERNARGLANLFVGLPHGLYRPPQSAADGVFRSRPLAGLASLEQPRKLSPHGSLDLRIAYRLGGGHSGTS